MTEEEIKDYFKNKKIYKYTGDREELESKLAAALISHNAISTNYTVYFICPNNEDAMVIADDKLSVLYTPEGA